MQDTDVVSDNYIPKEWVVPKREKHNPKYAEAKILRSKDKKIATVKLKDEMKTEGNTQSISNQIHFNLSFEIAILKES